MTRTHQLLGTLGINIFFLGALNAWQCVERVERVAVRGTRRTRRAEVHWADRISFTPNYPPSQKQFGILPSK